MKHYIKTLSLASATLLLSISCGSDNENISPIDTDLNAQIISDFSTNLPQATYNDLASKTSTFYTQVNDLVTGDATNTELEACRATWKSARQSWEQSEAFLFGPVATGDIDPRIDTWPVDFENLTAELAKPSGKDVFTDDYISKLPEALKGFHPIEYIIYGETGTKDASAITATEKEFLVALAKNLKVLTSDVKASWDPTVTDNYHAAFSKAGQGSVEYPTQAAAFEEMVNAMVGICGEVSEEKINRVFVAQDPKQEESPYSKNSITDFTNNIKGVQNVYLGKFVTDGKGLEDLVRQHNLQLDGTIKLKLNAAIDALGKVTKPFGEAIGSQQTQVKTAVEAIADLATTLNDELLPFVKAHSK